MKKPITKQTEVKHKQVKKLTQNDLKKITGGLEYVDHRDSKLRPANPPCLPRRPVN